MSEEKFEYDENGRLIRHEYPSGTYYEWKYNKSGFCTYSYRYDAYEESEEIFENNDLGKHLHNIQRGKWKSTFEQWWEYDNQGHELHAYNSHGRHVYQEYAIRNQIIYKINNDSKFLSL